MARRMTKRGAKKAAQRRKRYSKRRSKVGEYAELVQNLEVRTMTSGGVAVPLTTNQINGYFNYSLSSCDRAVQVARAYQLYRIKRVTVEVRPMFDTFITPGAVPSGSVPYLYYLIDKGFNNNSQIFNFNSMRDAGCKPIRMDDKTIRVSFTPHVANAVYDSGITPGGVPGAPGSGLYARPVKAPWLQTNANANQLSSLGPFQAWAPSSIDHRGIIIGAEQVTVAPSGASQYLMTFKVHFQFKKPNMNINDVPGIPPPGPRFELQDVETITN